MYSDTPDALLIPCKNCGNEIRGRFCSQCGQRSRIARLTLRNILHEVFHYFTHLDHGFPYTLKKLVSSPGKMQREYIDGMRARYQKPFSMFFISASVAALAMYLINGAVVKYFAGGDSEEVMFFNRYWVLLQVVMLPIYALLTHLIFRNTKFNYAEILVMLLYSLSFIFIMLILIHSLKLLFPHLQTRYIELPAFAFYMIITNARFFSESSRSKTLIKAIALTILIFFLAMQIHDFLIDKLM